MKKLGIGILNSLSKYFALIFQKKTIVINDNISIMDGFLESIIKNKEAKSKDNNQEIYRVIFENTGAATIIIEENKLLSLVNDKFAQLTGYKREEIEGRKLWTEFVFSEDLVMMKEYHAMRRKGRDVPKSYEFRLITKRGEVKNILLTIDVIPGTNKSIASLIDVTRQKKNEESIEHLNGTFNAMIKINKLITKEKNVLDLIRGVCDFLIENRNYHNAWIVLFDKNGKRKISAEAGLGDRFIPVDMMFRKWQLPRLINKVLKSPHAICINEPCEECYDCPLSNLYEGRSAMSVRLEYKGNVCGIMSVSVPKEIINREKELALFEDIAFDISFAIRRINLENRDKLMVKALKESEDRFKKMSTFAFEGILIHDNGIVKEVNASLEKFIGYSRDELLGNNIIDLCLPKEFNDIVMQNIAREVAKPYEISLKRKDGKIIDVEIESRVVLHNNKKIRVSAVRDISDRKIAADKLRVSENKFRQVYDNMGVGIARISMDYKIESANHAYCDMLGYTEEELVGMSLKDITHPEIIKENLIKQSQLGAGEINFFSMEKKFVCKDGSIKVGILEACVIEGSGNKEKYFLGTVIDITDRKRSEIVQSVIHNISNAIITTKNVKEFISNIKTQLDRVIYCSNFYVALVNEESQRLDVIYNDAKKYIRLDLPLGKNITSYIIRSEKMLCVTEHEILNMQEQGDFKFVGPIPKVWVGLPLIVKDKIIGVMALENFDTELSFSKQELNILEILSHQVSISLEKKKSEDDLKVALEKALESEKLKSSFLANMSHEIRTPMNGILGFLELLNDPDLTKTEKDEYTVVIQRNSDRLLNTINDIIDISRIDAGQVKINRKTLCINTMMDELYAFFNIEADKKGLLLIFKPGLPSGNDIMITDEIKLHAVMTNLIKNAIKYTDVGSVKFGYKLNDKFIEFFVIDTGIGIPENRREAIFNRFEQADVVGINSREGSGLGLAISKAYVEMMGGEMTLASCSGKGSTFSFTLPYEY